MKFIKPFLIINEMNRVLLLSALFCVAMVAFRIYFTGDLTFIFLVWNLFLAFIPYAISTWMEKKTVIKNKWTLLIAGLTWLLFIPNSFYIITDLFHLPGNEDAPLWFDLALLFSFAWSGILFGLISVRQVERIFEKYFNPKFDLLFIVPVMLLNGLGIYVGRYLRFNSWDVITNPFQLAEDIIYLFIHPLRNRLDWSMIICYSLLMTLIYMAVKNMSKVFTVHPGISKDQHLQGRI